MKLKKIKYFLQSNFTFFLPTKYKFLKKFIKYQNFTLLDVGAGNHSAKLTKSFFPNCKYYGIDITKNYNNDNEDFNCMEQFWEIDLTKLEFNSIQNNFFDFLMMTHIIEHLSNGELVLDALLKKVKNNGFIYLEYPSPRSVKLPSKRGTLNFYDDETHISLYDLKNLINIIENNGFKVIKSGIKRDYFNILIMPFKIIYNKLVLGYVPGGVFWDLLGFADFIFAKKLEN